MKTAYSLLILAPLAAFLSAGCASKYKTHPAGPAPVTSVVTVAPAQGGAAASATDEGQRVYGSATALPQQQHAGEIINNFRPAYEKLGSPRIVFYINRDLKRAARASASLADRQTARDIERIAARPFIQAGAALADQSALPAPKPAKDAAAPAEPAPPVADVAIETLVTSRQVSLPSISGQNNIVTIPDIQMTAIRLSDSAILGQATASDVVNQLPPAALGSLNVHDALEATALNLMNDITARAK